MKYRLLGLILVLVALAGAVSIFAFTTAEVNSAGTISITAQDQLLALTPGGSPDNPSGMISRVSTGAGTGKVTIDFGSNGTSSKGLQADSTYQYNDVVRVLNNNATSKNIDVEMVTPPAGWTVELALAAHDGTNCGTFTYAANPSAVAAANGAYVCVGFKITVPATASNGAQNLNFKVTAQ